MNHIFPNCFLVNNFIEASFNNEANQHGENKGINLAIFSVDLLLVL